MSAVERHLDSLRDAEQIGSARASLWHLQQLIAHQPENSALYARRAMLWAELGDMDQAAADSEVALSKENRSKNADRFRHAARDQIRDGNWKAAVWLLEKIIASGDGDWHEYVDRALAYEKLGQIDKMESDFVSAKRLGCDDETKLIAARKLAQAGRWSASDRFVGTQMSWPHSYYHCVARLSLGDRDGYRKICNQVKAAMNKNLPSELKAEVAWLFALEADATDDWSGPLGWVEKALKEFGNKEGVDWHQIHAWRNTRGVLLYRAGRFREAADELREAINLHDGGGVPIDWLFLGLACSKLGETEQAAELLAKAAAPAKFDDVWSRAEWEFFRREAERKEQARKP